MRSILVFYLATSHLVTVKRIMSSNKLIVVTAEEADLKIINRLLLNLRDWEFADDDDDDTWDHCTILRTLGDIMKESHETDKPPIHELPNIEYRGQSIQEVESLMLAKAKEGEHAATLLLILDSEGIDQGTIIIAERAINSSEDVMDDDQSLYLNRYNKVRVPWMEAHSMWCNLDISNMGFEEYCEDDESASDGWFTYKSIMSEEHYEEFNKRRDAVLRELAKLDLA